MLREFAAKQQMLTERHIFSEAVSDTHLTELDELWAAIQLVVHRRLDGQKLRNLLLSQGPIETTAGLFRIAAGPEQTSLTSGTLGAALGLVYIPLEWIDTMARHLLSPMSLKAIADAIDPRKDLVVRTRLFLADRMLKDPTLRSLIAGVAATVLLRENSANRTWPEVAHPTHRSRLARMARVVQALRNEPERFSDALGDCMRWSYAKAEDRLRESLPAEDAGEMFPPVLADLFVVCLLPNCEAVDAITRLRGGVIFTDAIETRFVAS